MSDEQNCPEEGCDYRGTVKQLKGHVNARADHPGWSEVQADLERGGSTDDDVGSTTDEGTDEGNPDGGSTDPSDDEGADDQGESGDGTDDQDQAEGGPEGGPDGGSMASTEEYEAQHQAEPGDGDDSGDQANQGANGPSGGGSGGWSLPKLNTTTLILLVAAALLLLWLVSRAGDDGAEERRPGRRPTDSETESRPQRRVHPGVLRLAAREHRRGDRRDNGHLLLDVPLPPPTGDPEPADGVFRAGVPHLVAALPGATALPRSGKDTPL